MLRSLLPAVLALTLTAGSAMAEARIRVSASIVPIHGLVAAVMEGVAEPDLILPPGASPHGYALRPSDALALSRADVIFRVGPSLEAFLNRPLANLSKKARVVELIEAPGMRLLPVRDNEAFEPHHHDHGEHADHDGHDDHEKHADHDGHDDHEKHADHDGHDDHAKHADHDGHDDHAKHADHDGHDDHEKHADHDGHDDHEKHADHDGHEGDTDQHVWLDPQNAIAIVRHVADVLGEADPTNASIYRENATRTIRRLNELESSTAERVASVTDRPFIVFHDAYQYFENRFGVTAAGSIAINPEVSPGARQISLIRSRITEQNIHCVLAEPQFNSDIVEALASDNHVHVGVVDPVGTTSPAATDNYFGMMDRLVTQLTTCLGATG